MNMENIVVGDDELIDFLVHAKKTCITSGKNSFNRGQLSYEIERLGSLCQSSYETVKFRRDDLVFWIHYGGHLKPEALPVEIGEDGKHFLMRRVNNFLNKCCLGVEPSRPFRGPEERKITFPGFEDMRYAAQIDSDCLSEAGAVNLNHFGGTDVVVIEFEKMLYNIWEGRYVGGRVTGKSL